MWQSIYPYLCKLTLIQCPQSPSHEWCQCLHTVSLCHSMQSWFHCQYKDVVGGQPMSSPCADRLAPWHAWWMCCKPRLQTPPVHQKQESNYIYPASHTEWCSKLVSVREEVSKTNLTCLLSKRNVSIEHTLWYTNQGFVISGQKVLQGHKLHTTLQTLTQVTCDCHLNACTQVEYIWDQLISFDTWYEKQSYQQLEGYIHLK